MGFNAGSIESVLTLDRSPFQAGLDAAKAEAEEFARQRYSANLEADLTELNARIDEAKAKLDEVAGQHPTAKLDADGAEVTTKVEQASAKVDEFAGKRPTATLDVDNAAANAKIAETSAAATALGGIDPEIRALFDDADAITQMGAFKAYIDDAFPPGKLYELRVMAQIQEAMLNLDRLETRLAALKAQPEDVKVTASIEDLEAKVNAAQVALLSLVDKHVTIDVDDNGSFSRLKTEAEQAGKGAEGALSGITGALGGMSTQVQLVAAAFPLISAAVLAVPAAIALIGVPIAAAVVGVDGLKAVVHQLAPEFAAVQASVSAAFVTGLQPAIASVSALMPTLTAGLTGTATALSTVVDKVTAFVASGPGISALTGIFSGVNAIITSMAGPIATLTANLLTMADQGLQGLSGLGAVMTQIGAQWTATLNEMAQTGTLQGAVSGLVDVFGGLMAVIPPLLEIGAQLAQILGPTLGAALQVLGFALQGVASAVSIVEQGFNSLSGPVQGVLGVLNAVASGPLGMLNEGLKLAGINLGDLGGKSATATGQVAGLTGQTNTLAGADQAASSAANALTSAITAQGSAMQTAVGSALSLQSAEQQVTDAQTQAAKAIAQYGLNSQQAQEAITSAAQAMDREAQAADKNAQSLTAGAGATAQATTGNNVYIGSLGSLAQGNSAAAGTIRTLLGNMDQATLSAASTAAQMTGLATTVVQLPNGKTITVLVDGSQVAPAFAAVTNQAAGTKAVVPVTANTAPFTGPVLAARNAAGAPITPPFIGNPALFNQIIAAAKTQAARPVNTPVLAGMSGFVNPVSIAKINAAAGVTTPVAATTAPFTAPVAAVKGQAAQPVTTPVRADVTQATGAVTGLAAQVNSTTGVMHVNAEAAPATGILAGFVATVTGTTAIAHLNAEPAGANSVLQSWVFAVNGSTGTAHIAANDSAARATLASLLSAINSSSATVTIKANRVGFAGGGVAPAGFAGGGIAPRWFADGGVEPPMTPMPVGVPAVAEPNHLRVFGDRSDVDEFYIPDDGRPASLGLIGVAAGRQGMALTPLADGGLVSTADAMMGELAAVNIRAEVAAAGSGSDRFSGLLEAVQGLRDDFARLRADLGRARGVTNNTNIYNPAAERSSDSVNTRLRTLSALGIFG